MKTAELDHQIDSKWRIVRCNDAFRRAVRLAKPVVDQQRVGGWRPQAQTMVWNFEPELAKAS